MGALSTGLISCQGTASSGAPSEKHAENESLTSTDPNHYDVIVIGGGFAGVTAARDLKKSGYSVLILEARNRLGGRTFTSEFAGRQAEMGGTWVHELQPYVWAEMKRYGIGVKETEGATPEKIIYRSQGKIGSAPTLDLWAGFDKAANKLLAPAHEVIPKPYQQFYNAAGVFENDGISIAEAIKNAKLEAPYSDMVDGLVGVFAHNYNNQVGIMDIYRFFALSNFSFEELNNTTTRYKMDGGTVKLINAMVEEAKPKVKLGAVVMNIAQNEDGVSITTEDEEIFTASAAVVTVPMNVLKDIEFDPKLDNLKLSASNETHGGSGIKFHVLLKGNYGSISCLAPNKEALNLLMTEKSYENETHMLGFGPSSDALDVNDTNAIQKAVRGFLPDAEVLDAFGYQWEYDPFSQGTWCMFRPHQTTRYLKALQAPQGRLFFANGDWAAGWRGSIDGAIERGKVAAVNVSNRLCSS